MDGVFNPDRSLNGWEGSVTCKSCKWLDVALDKAGRRVVRKQNAYPCLAPDPERPKVPASVEERRGGFPWPPHRIFMCGYMGEDCPCWEALP